MPIDTTPMSTTKLGLLYTVGRFGCFLAVAGALYLLGVRSVWVIVLVAVLLSAPISYFLLRPVRLAWSARLEEGSARRRSEKEKLRAALRGDDDPEDQADPAAVTASGLNPVDAAEDPRPADAHHSAGGAHPVEPDKPADRSAD